MARRKRVPHKPDAFQSHGMRAALALAGQGKTIAVCLALAGVAFVVAFVVLHSRGKTEEDAWTGYYHARGDVEKLQRALEIYGSTSARPHMLYSVARADMDPSRDESGDEGDTPGNESPEKRKARLARAAAARTARLARAEYALRDLTDDYPDHFLSMYGLSLLGLVLEEQGRYDKDKYAEAASVLERALKGAHTTLNPKIRYDIGRNYVLAGKPEAARFHLERATEAGRAGADWIENARYLLARVGPGERAIPIPKKREPGPPPRSSGPAGKGAPSRPTGTPASGGAGKGAPSRPTGTPASGGAGKGEAGGAPRERAPAQAQGTDGSGKGVDNDG